MADLPKIPKTTTLDNQGVTPGYLVSVATGTIKSY